MTGEQEEKLIEGMKDLARICDNLLDRIEFLEKKVVALERKGKYEGLEQRG